MRERLWTFGLVVGGLATLVAVVLAWYEFSQLAVETRALVVGCVGGLVLLMVPVVAMLAVAWLALRWSEARHARRPAQRESQAPAVVVVNPAAQQPALPAQQQAWIEPRAAREFAVIGGDDGDRSTVAR